MADSEHQWPTLAESMALRRQGILDERHLRVRPSPAERKRMRAEAEAFLADRRAREAAADAETARPA
jgi:hypothetical protein